MTTNHERTPNYASRLMPLLRCVSTRNLTIAMFIALALLGTTRGNETEKTMLAHCRATGGKLSQGSLVVYSATDPFADGGLSYYVHSPYTVYTTNGKLFKNVENHISKSDSIPEVVTLPVGSYVIEARSENDRYVRVLIVIKAGRQTILNLESRDEESLREIAGG